MTLGAAPAAPGELPAPVALMLDARLRRLIDPPLDRAGEIAGARAASGADAVTLGGFGVGLAAMLAVADEAYGLGLRSSWPSTASPTAWTGRWRGSSRLTDLGGFLDIVLDFIVYAGMVFAFAVADPARNALAAAFLLFAFMGTGSSFLAFAIMAAKRGLSTELRGRKSLYYLGGLTEGTETILFLALGLPAARMVPAAGLVFARLCWMTTRAGCWPAINCCEKVATRTLERGSTRRP